MTVLDYWIEEIAHILWAPNYYDYIRSEHWRRKRKAALKRANYRCQLCYSKSVPLHCHHRTYKRLGHERPSDLTILCNGCHTMFHTYRKVRR